MGPALCKVFKQQPVKILFFGLDAVGKTTLLYKLKLGEVVTTIPTIGFNVETLDINGINTIVWDVGLRNKSRPLLRHYMDNTDAIIFMVDSTDRERLKEAVDEFFSYVNETVQERKLPVLVLANKQDSSKVMSHEEIKQAIYEKGGKAFQRNTALEVFPTVALTLEGMTPALEWLSSQLALVVVRNGYAPFWTKATQYSASIVKSTYHKVTGLFYTADSEEEKLSEEPVADSASIYSLAEGKFMKTFVEF